MHLAQRPAGAYHLTLTVTPDAFGPITVRARIGAGGDVRIELTGGTEAGRDALRVMVADLRRDLATVSPSAHLSLGAGSADAGAGDRAGAGGPNGSPADPQGHGRDGRADQSGDSSSPVAPRTPAASPAHPVSAPAGGGLDIFA